MTKTKVIVCSNSGIDYIDNDYDIEVFRSVVQYGENEKYDDYTEISAETFYNRLITDKASFPHTAYVSPGRMIEIFEEAKAKGYDSALVITIAKPLSGLYNAVELYKQEVTDFNVTVYNSKSLAFPEAFMALEAARMFKDDKTLEEVLGRLDYIRDNHHVLFAVDTLEYLIKNGRLSRVSGMFANMLSIRPVVDLDEEGKVRTLEKIRTSKSARKRLVEMFLEEIEGKDVIPCIIHASAAKEKIEEVRNAVLAKRPDLKEINDYMLTPVVGAHTGPETVGLSYIIK